MWDSFRGGRKRFVIGQAVKAIENYKILVQISEDLFYVFPVDQERQKVCQKEWGVKMTDKEYYEDMKSARRMQCDRGVDPVSC